MIETVNNLMEVPEDELAKAAEEGSTNVVVQSLETQLLFVNASYAAYKEVDDNLGVHVCFFFFFSFFRNNNLVLHRLSA